jgi:putative tryptophan/tyrosine transport system substrate-binding protein
MQRREFISLLGGAAAAASFAWPRAVRAQQHLQKRRVAVLMGGLFSGDAGGQAEASALEDGLTQLGWKLGGNIELDYHWPGAELNSVRAAAAEIAAARPDLVVSRSTPSTEAIKDSGLPVVFVLVSDPLGSGIVQNLGQPGGNLTGFSVYEGSVGGKWLALLKEAAPRVSRVTLLFNPQTAPFADNYLRSAQAAAQTLDVTVISAPCGGASDIENAFAVRAREGGGGIIGVADTSITEHRDLIIALAARLRLPAVYGSRDFIAPGGLMAYSADFPEVFRSAAGYVDRILRGTRPGGLPVQAPDKFTLSVNLKAANVIGLTLPQTLIARADEVIE